MRTEITAYNFSDAERVQYGRFPVLDAVFARWGRRIEETLFEEAQVEVYAGASVVEEMRFSTFFGILNRPRPIYFTSLEPFEGTGLFAVDNRFSAFCLLQSNGEDDVAEGSPRLSPGNQLRLQKIVQRLMLDFDLSWKGIHEGVKTHLKKITTYPFRARILNPYEYCLVAQIHLSGHEISSRLTWCFPRSLLSPILPQLSESRVIPPPTAEPTEMLPMDKGALLEHLRFPLRARMGRISVAKAVRDLQVGEIVPLEETVDADAIVEMNGEPVMVASVGTVDGHVALKIKGGYQDRSNSRVRHADEFLPTSFPEA